MEWNMSEVFKLINLYKQFECLWNFKSPTYKRIDLKKNAWMEIANKCGKDIEDVKKKIKNLRCAYVNEKKKVDSSKKSGCSTESLHESHLFYFSEMQFLDSVVVLRKTLSTLNTQSVQFGEEVDSFLFTPTPNVPVPSPSPTTLSACSPVPCSSSSMPSPSPPTSTETRPSTSLGRRKRTANLDAKFERAIEAITASATTEDDDIFSSFSRSIALQLKQLSLVEANETMLQIQQLVTQNVVKSMSASQSTQKNRNSERDLLQTALEDADIPFF